MLYALIIDVLAWLSYRPERRYMRGGVPSPRTAR
jgi:hypothetical protein